MNGKSQRIRIWAIVGALAVLSVLVPLLWMRNALRPVTAGGLVTVVVHPGDTAGQVAAVFAQAGLVRNAFWFRVYLGHAGVGKDIQAGAYRIAKGTTLADIAAQLTAGSVSNNTVRVTIPEGYTVLQIAKALQSNHILAATTFLRAEQRDAFAQTFLRQIPHNAQVKYRLEGYLFPDTYDFYPGEPVDEVIGAMLDDFARHVAALQSHLSRAKLTLAQVVIVASLIEREAKVQSERPLIASVIYNRLRRGMPLQIDATLEYILGYKSVLTDADTQVKDPYNTYLHRGLPPGPIANPGMASILAALHPAATPYLYYVVRNDGSGRDYFARTYPAQLANIARSQSNLKRLTNHASP